MVTKYPVPQEYRDFLKGKLNPFERFNDLFSGKDDRQDFTNVLLWHLLQVVSGINPTDSSSNVSVTIPTLGVKSEECLTNIAALTTDEIKPSNMIDCRASNRILLVVNNGFDQEVTVTVIGNNFNNSDSAKLINTFKVSAGESGAYGLKFEEWMPYVACKVTPTTAPTQGTVGAAVIKQEAS